MPKLFDNTNEEKWFSEQLLKYEDDWEYNLERALLDITEQISKQLEKEKLTRSKLARILGVSRSYISQLLNGKPNLRLRTLFKVSYALGLRPKINLQLGTTLQRQEYVIEKRNVYQYQIRRININPIIIRSDYETKNQTARLPN